MARKSRRHKKNMPNTDTQPVPGAPPAITVYRTSVCAYCVMAARLLTKRGYAFTEVWLDGKHEARQELEARTHWRTVPQIFVGDRFVGGYTDLAALDASGELKRLMAPSPEHDKGG